MPLAVVRVRGTVLARGTVFDTLDMMRLTRANHCVVVQDSKSIRGMLVKAQDYITWGEVSPQMVARLLLKRGRVVGGEKLTDAYIKSNSKYNSIWDFTQAFSKGEASVKDVNGLNPVLRLHPPLKGFKSVKLSFRSGGDLGNRGKEIENLLTRMIEEEK